MRYTTDLPRPVKAVENVWIPMPDGTRLAARMWLPEDAGDDPVPAILEYIPYRKRDMTRMRDEIMHPYVAGHGYACVRVDMRGSGDSDGVLTDEYLEVEQSDALAVLAWLGAQSWCTGRVGMMGKSWGGFNSLQVAALDPPELGAVVAVCATDDRYADDVHYMGGCLLGDNLSWASTMFAYNSCPPDPEIVGSGWRDAWFERLEGSGFWLHTWLQHQRRDAYWRHGSINENWAAVTSPVLVVSGWADGYSNAVFRMLENLTVPCKALVGPWSHKYPHLGVPGPAIDFMNELLRWWDHWLKGVETGVIAEPRLRVWMQDSVEPTTRYVHRPGRWVAEAEWPTDRICEKRWMLTRRGLAPAEDVTPGGDHDSDDEPFTIQSPITTGLFAGKWCSYSATPDLPHDQREEDGGALVFDSPPLDETIEILGSPMLDLDVTATEPVAMIAVRLSDVHPDDKATRITYGLLNLTHRDGHETPQPMESGAQYRVQVQLNDVAQRFPAGHRIRLAISTSYWPLAWLPPRPVRLRFPADTAVLTLPVRPPADSDDDLRDLGGPVGCAPPQKTIVETGHRNWLVHRDLERDRSTLEVIRDEGRYRLDDIDLEVRSDTREWYTTEGADFDSAEGRTRCVRGFRRDGWDIETVTHTVLRATPEEFLLHADLDAFEDGDRVFARSWNVTVVRDHV